MRLGQDVLGMDLYRVLGVPSSATTERIRQAYRRLARGSHPDLNPGWAGRAERRMVELNVAASILLDPLRRGEYDRQRAMRRVTRQQQSRPSRAQAAGWYPWSTAGYPDRAPDDWTRQPRRGHDPALDRELHLLLGHLRLWPARLMLALSLSSSHWSPRTHAVLTFASVGLAFLLIACAQPRSLPMYQGDDPVSRQPTVMTAPR